MSDEEDDTSDEQQGGEDEDVEEAFFSRGMDQSYYAYLRSHDGGSKSVAEAKYSVVIAKSYVDFARDRVQDPNGMYALEDNCLASTGLFSPWLASLTNLSLASKRSWLSRLSRFVKYRSSRGSHLNREHALVFWALSRAKEKLLQMQQSLRESIREEYAETQSLEALKNRNEWATLKEIMDSHVQQKEVFFKIIQSQARTPRAQMGLKTRTWCLGFVATSLYTLLSSARRE